MPTLSRRERRLLRDIERGLLDDDPGLADLLGGLSRAPEGDSVHQLAYVWVALAFLLIVGGLSLHEMEMEMVLGGVIVLGVLPVAIALVVLVKKTGR